tara:strand:- start:3743 stop:3943 length:201 start_codon:yes stop_codon:yes gene_type:complete
MLLNINGKEKQLSESKNVAEMVRELEIDLPHFAVALNYDIVPKSQYESTYLNDGDKVEIVHAVGGG